jgi:hypothetical protein
LNLSVGYLHARPTSGAAEHRHLEWPTNFDGYQMQYAPDARSRYSRFYIARVTCARRSAWRRARSTLTSANVPGGLQDGYLKIQRLVEYAADEGHWSVALSSQFGKRSRDRRHRGRLNPPAPKARRRSSSNRALLTARDVCNH